MRKTLLILMILVFISSFVWAQEGKIIPGAVINKDNYEKYLPELEKFLIPSGFSHIVNHGLKKGVITIPVVETTVLPNPKDFEKMSIDNEGKYKVGKDNVLIGPSWAGRGCIPFRNPKTGAELMWNAYRKLMNEDSEFFADMLLYSKDGKLERSFSQKLWKKMWCGRYARPPIPEMPGNNGVLNSKEAMIITKPFDVKGFSMVRIRYEDLYKSDESYSYIPALRRVRRLTTEDVCDPVLGSDQIFDDFETWRQKPNKNMTCNILPLRDFLVPVTSVLPYRPKNLIANNCLQAEWEIRPLWTLQINTNDPNYIYSKRILYVENLSKSFLLYGGEGYDQRGRLYKSNWGIVFERDTDIPNGQSCWQCGIYKNNINNHSSTMDLYFNLRNPNTPAEIFTIKELLKKAK
jgi:hypothetical protein